MIKLTPPPLPLRMVPGAAPTAAMVVGALFLLLMEVPTAGGACTWTCTRCREGENRVGICCCCCCWTTGGICGIATVGCIGTTGVDAAAVSVVSELARGATGGELPRLVVMPFPFIVTVAAIG